MKSWRQTGAALLIAAGLAVSVGAFLGAAEELDASTSKIAVITSSGVQAYSEALEGLRLGLGERAQQLMVIDLATGDNRQNLPELLEKSAVGLAVAVGTDATNVVASQGKPIPFVSTMVLGTQGQDHASPTGSEKQRVGAVTLDVSLPKVVSELKRIFPGKTRLGIVRNRLKATNSSAQLQAEAKRQGFSVRIVEIDGPNELLQGFLSLKGKVDFVWCLPDGSIYTAATVKPLVVASLRNRLPIIGFSVGFVRSGAAMGVFPDFRDIGEQTAEVVKKFMATQSTLGEQGPRKVKVAVNQRITRMLGLRLAVPKGETGSLVIVR